MPLMPIEGYANINDMPLMTTEGYTTPVHSSDDDSDTSSVFEGSPQTIRTDGTVIDYVKPVSDDGIAATNAIQSAFETAVEIVLQKYQCSHEEVGWMADRWTRAYKAGVPHCK